MSPSGLSRRSVCFEAESWRHRGVGFVRSARGWGGVTLSVVVCHRLAKSTRSVLLGLKGVFCVMGLVCGLCFRACFGVRKVEFEVEYPYILGLGDCEHWLV